MKLTIAALCLACAYSFAQEPVAEDIDVVPAVPGSDTIPLIIEARRLQQTPPPLFFSASSQSVITLNAHSWSAEIDLELRVLQGKADLLVLAIHGDGDITSVSGDGIAAWGVARRTVGDRVERFLEIRPTLGEDGKSAATLKAKIVVSAKDLQLPAEANIFILGAGDAVGFSSLISLSTDASLDVRIAAAFGLVPVGGTTPSDRNWKFQSFGEGKLSLHLTPGGAALAAVEMVGVSLTGSIDESGRSARFVLTGEARVSAAEGGHIDILSGRAAVSELPAGDAFSLRLDPRDEAPVYQLVFPSAGTFPVRFEFQAGLSESDGHYGLDFLAPAGAVVPVNLDGLAGDSKFDSAAAVFPLLQGVRWTGFLAANGRCQLAWQKASDQGEGKLFFASDAIVDAHVGAGLLRQSTLFDLTPLQGKLDGVNILLEGEGAILSVEGDAVLGWTVTDAGEGKRLLRIQSSQPIATKQSIVVRSQAPLGDFPVKLAPLRLTPQGAVRHSGYLRVSNSGAVRLEVNGVTGLTQIAPEQFPGDALPDGARQVFVYRFPSAGHSYQINADQILPEISVSQILIYEMTDTDRVIDGRIELDIREAPVREWTLRIPEGYAVVSVDGAEIADHVISSEAEGDSRLLKILFRNAVIGRQLVQFRLEKNIAAAAGPWSLPALSYPGAKSVRGHVGAAVVAGFRATPAQIDNLSEVPMAYFPEKTPGLQQTFRLRDAAWSATLDVAALAQSVQVDVFHLYSLKQGIAYGSVLLNYFVVGAPVGEWRLEVPEGIGNLAVEGQNVQGWRRDEATGQLVITLHQPTLGAATLLLTFEQPIDTGSASLHPGQVKPVGVQSERGFIQVVSPSQVRHEITAASPGLLKLSPLELPAEFRLLTSSPSLAIYQYSARPLELALDIKWSTPGKTIDQVVDYANLDSHVSGDGQVVTNAKFYVRSRGHKALRLQLPAGARLWEASVNGATVNARTDADMTLVPLPAGIDPNTPIQVGVSFGQTADNPRRPTLVAPTLSVPTVIATWTVRGDPDRRLVPAGRRTPALTDPMQTETGFTWLQARGGSTPLLLVTFALIGIILTRAGTTARAPQIVGIVLLSISIVMAAGLASRAGDEQSVGQSTLEFVAPVVPGGESVTLQLRNVAAWETYISWPGVVVVLVGIALLAGGRLIALSAARPPAAALGIALLGGGLLAQRGGAAPFLITLAVFLYLYAIHPPLRATVAELRCRAARRRQNTAAKTPDGGVTSCLLALCVSAGLLGAFGTSSTQAADPPPMADSVSQVLRIHDDRIYADLELQIDARQSDTLLLLRSPAVLTAFAADGLRVTKREVGGAVEYWLVVERTGRTRATLSYELPLTSPVKSFTLPTGGAAVQRLDLRYEQPGWEFLSPAAIKIEPLPDLPANASGARMILSPGAGATVHLKPKSRDLSTEKATFFAEVANLFLPAPGLVDGRHKVIVRPSRGQLASLDLDVPEGFTVSEVVGNDDDIDSWRFDPESRSLHIRLAPAKTKPFSLLVSTQQSTGALPATTTLRPLGVRGAVSQVGTLAVAFGSDAQPEKITPDHMSKVNLDDFDTSLLPADKDGQPLIALHQAFRYQGTTGSVIVTAAAVAPEVRVSTRQTLSIGADRLVLAVDLLADITRAGLFKLSFLLTNDLEIETASGDALSHWTESGEGERRIITLHLNGRTIGAQKFAISLTGPAPTAQEEWPVPRFSIREATRQTGQLLVVPEQGIRAAAASRQHVSQLDARRLSGGRNGTLAFRLLQADWQLGLALEQLDTWITAQALQEVTLRESLTRTRLSINYQVENAAVKTLRLHLPGLTADEEKTVRAGGKTVADIVKIETAEDGDTGAASDLWELRFSRRILGSAKVEIDYQRTADRSSVTAGGQTDRLRVARLVGVRQAAYWVAIRVSDHLEISIAETPRGWERVDWSAIPRDLHDPRDRSMPAFAFRAVEPEAALAVKIQRHSVAETLSLRIGSGHFTTVFSPGGASITEAKMQVEVIEKSAMNICLPDTATLLGAFVNDESVGIVSEGDAHRFYVHPREQGGTAQVAISWSHTPAKSGSRKVSLTGPEFNVPLQNITWEVILPAGYTLRSASGTLDLADRRDYRHYDFEEYQQAVLQRRDVLHQDGIQSLEKGIRWRDQGDQRRALIEFARAADNQELAPAANEDARVQLRELQTEQTILGLNTRRQKLYLDNVGETNVAPNQQLEQAAERNPLLQGQLNYDPQKVDMLLLGNSAEETGALRRIATRLVGQRLAAEPALQAIDVPVQGRGEVLTFHRSVQVDGGSPLQLNLRIAREGSHGFSLLALLALAVMMLLCYWKPEGGTPSEFASRDKLKRTL